MHTLPATMIRYLTPFAPLFSRRVFRHIQVLIAGAILASGKRTVASTLRAIGVEGGGHFCRYHRVLREVPPAPAEKREPSAAGIARRSILAVADRAYASLKLLECCQDLSNTITFITRLRLDAALYKPAPPQRPIRWEGRSSRALGCQTSP